MDTFLVEEKSVQHQALYRKYRPNGFEGLVGQDHVKVTIENAILQGKVSHAYLFTGPRGTGKTTSARLIAKALNCQEPNGINPCGKCSSCLNHDTDIIELDAASNNGVDDIRQLRENVILAPMNGKYKIYIIDEVHMLTQAAFNAFLKTLEEPPAHAIFILATTEVHKLPATILSRCQRFDFRRISNQEIVNRLKYVLKQEGRKAEDTALNLIAQVSAGGMRDAISLLDQALARKTEVSDTVTLSDVLALTGAVDVRVIGQLIAYITDGKTAEAIAHFNQCFESGKEPKFFIEEMMIYLRDILVFKKLGETATLKKGNTDENFQAVASRVSIDRIYIYLEELQQTLNNSKYHHDLQLLLEMTIIRMINGEQVSLQEQINELRNMISNSGGSFTSLPTQQSPVQQQFEPSKVETNAVQQFETSQVELNAVQQFEPSPVETNAVQQFETFRVNLTDAQNSNTIQEEQNSDLVEVNDPIGFIQMAQQAKVNGTDWTTQLPSEVNNSQVDGTQNTLSQAEISQVGEQTLTGIPSEPQSSFEQSQVNLGAANISGHQQTENPVNSAENSNAVNSDLLISETMGDLPSNVILSDKEKDVLSALETATKELKVEFEEVRDNVTYEIKNLNISTSTIFREFQAVAVNPDKFILVHAKNVNVKLIEKPIHKKRIIEAFQNNYKPLDFIAITQQEWDAVVSVYRSMKNKR